MKYKDQMSWVEYQQSLFSGAFTKLNEWDRDRVGIIINFIGTGKTVIDLGSGCGAIGEEVRKQGNGVWILDSKKAVEIAKKNFPKLNILAGTALDIPTNEKFDVVLVSELIEHIIDIDKLFLEVKRVMKDNGIMIITTPNCSRLRNIVDLIRGLLTRGFDYMYENPIHIRFFTPVAFAQTLVEHGFKIIQMNGAYTPAGRIDWGGFTEKERKIIENVYKRFRTNYPIDIDEKVKLQILNADLTVFVCKK